MAILQACSVLFLGWDPATRAPPGSALALVCSRLLGLLSELLSSPSSYSAETRSISLLVLGLGLGLGWAALLESGSR